MLRFTISGRSKTNEEPVLAYLARAFPGIPLRYIDSVFGFVERSPLYGGRIFEGPELLPSDVEAMYGAGIGVRIPLTNHFAEPEEYAESAPVLEKYHRPGNAAIVTNDALARWIRRDFPQYRIEASVIKNLKTYDRIAKALDLYDTAVLPMDLCEDEDFLEGLPDKDRITLFANAACALTCPSKICYRSISKFNKDGDGELLCSGHMKERTFRGMVDFDLRRLNDLGFTRFKVLRPVRFGPAAANRASAISAETHADVEK